MMIENTWQMLTKQLINDFKSDSAFLGKEKEIILKNGEILMTEIVGVNHDIFLNGSQASLTFAIKYPLAEDQMLFDINTSPNGNWENSDLRKWLHFELLPQFPDELRNLIKPVRKQTYGRSAKHPLIITEDHLFLFSEMELFENPTYVGGEGKPYPYFKKNSIRTLANEESHPYYTRTCGPYDTFVAVLSDGSSSYKYGLSGVYFGFCIELANNQHQTINSDIGFRYDQLIEKSAVLHNLLISGSQYAAKEKMNNLLSQLIKWIPELPSVLAVNSKLLNYYLPTAQTLLERYEKFVKINDLNIEIKESILAEIKDGIDQINIELSNLIKKIMMQIKLETEVDVNVLKSLNEQM